MQVWTPDERAHKPPHAKTRGWASIITSFAYLVPAYILRDFYNHKLVAILMVPVAAICLIHDAWPWLLGALALLAVGFLIWRRPGDLAHAVWHVCTAAAMTLIVIGL